jgi:hypothetical protein
MPETEAACSSRCSNCGGAFVCGFANGASRCWCFDQPVVAVEDASQGCVCPQCLAARIESCRHRAQEAQG